MSRALHREGFGSKLGALLCALAYGVVFYRPHRDSLLGNGGDVYFNFWTLETVWHHLTTLGPWRIFTDAFWDTGIFQPLPLTLALSENQIGTALLSWPLRALLGNGALALGVFAFLLHVAAFASTWAWLRSLGLSRLAPWGALLFVGCGWMQGHVTHYQNLCVFLFPFALWRWNRFQTEASPKNLLLAAFAFGWIFAWNAYFQVLANFLLVALAAWTFYRRPAWRVPTALVVGGAALLQIPFALKYTAVAELIGGHRAAHAQLAELAASPLSFLRHGTTGTWLQSELPFYPRPRANLEGSGFVGFAWFALCLAGLFGKKSRPWSLAALCFYVVSLGPRFYLHGLFRFFPGADALRAVGRVQVLFALLSIPALLTVLERHSKKVAGLWLLAILIELTPAAGPAHESFPVELNGAPSEFSRAVLEKLPPGEGLLPWIPFFDFKFQAYSVQTHTPQLLGYSGRFPIGAARLQESIADARGDGAKIRAILRYAQAHWVVTLEAPAAQALRQTQLLVEHGCYAHFDLRPCLFELKPGTLAALDAAGPRPLDLTRDGHWEESFDGHRHSSRWVADRAGRIELATLARCRIESRYAFGFGYTLKQKRPLPLPPTLEFKAGETVLEDPSETAILRLPGPFRAARRNVTVCR